RFSDVIRRNGGDFEKYIQARDPQTNYMPAFMVRIRQGNEETVQYFSGEKELADFAQANPDLMLFGRSENGDGNGNGNGLGSNGHGETKTRRARLTEIHEANSIRKL